jgi:hypothetical protein|tara:strand:- start:16 stop:276 length:261 start_codon:yes stop_codon:yes gene_type:complete
MRNFLIKTSVVFIFTFILIRFTVISLINDYETRFSESFSTSSLVKLKTTIMDGIKKSNSQDQILYKEDAEILGVFFKKIFIELDLK